MWLHRYATFVSACTVLLIVAGGLVTSTGSGLSVPDWPTSYGWSMFTFPMRHMVGGIFYEHGHRLIASGVGFLTIVLAIWLWRAEPRRWLRLLGLAALGAVVLQGVLGGITVLFFLPTAISTAHAGLAQIFFCLTVSIALFTSPNWDRPAAGGWVDDAMLRRTAAATTAIIYLQIIVGATMRHADAGLAIPDFPLVFGGLVPPHWTPQIAIHYAHRAGALLVAAAITATAGHVFFHHGGRRDLVRPARLLTALVLIQIALGGLVVLTRKDVAINTIHVVNGALVLASSLVLTLRSYRVRFADSLGGPAALARTRCGLRALGGARVKKRAGAFAGAVHLKRPAFTYSAPAGTAAAQRAADFLSLTKPRLNFLVIVTAGVGYYLGASELSLLHGAWAIAATALVAGGAAGLNQVYERDTDSLMWRTRARPIAAERLTPAAAGLFSSALVAAGLLMLAAGANWLAAALAAATVLSYNIVYTPMKRRSQLATLVGAVPGALPPMIGWAAARGSLGAGAWALFAIVFVWQIPHFMAIAWMYPRGFRSSRLPHAAGAAA